VVRLPGVVRLRGVVLRREPREAECEQRGQQATHYWELETRRFEAKRHHNSP